MATAFLGVDGAELGAEAGGAGGGADGLEAGPPPPPPAAFALLVGVFAAEPAGEYCCVGP